MQIDAARELVAATMDCLPGEVIFTSSGTEACVTAILGVARAGVGGSRKRVLMGAAEHHAVLHCREQLEELGFVVETVPASPSGAMDVSRLDLGDDVLLVCAMHANNETGAITDVDAVASACKDVGALYFCDAIQTFGKLSLPDADLIAVSAHKVCGPKGVGALRIRAGVKVEPLVAGGGQEREMRGGTENVAAIVGFGSTVMFWGLPQTKEQRAEDGPLEKVAEWLMPPLERREPETSPVKMPAYPDDGGYHLVEARDRFVHEVRQLLPDAMFAALDSACLPTHAHVRVPGVSAEVVLINLDRLGVAASSGAACSSGSVEPSHVLLAMGLTEREASEGLRFTFGTGNTERHARKAAEFLAQAVNEARAR